MSDWIPEVSVMSEDRAVILQLIQLCKREMTYHRATIQALQILANRGQSALAIQIADAIQAGQGTVRQDVDVLFRGIESALTRGQAYLRILQELLSKH